MYIQSESSQENVKKYNLKGFFPKGYCIFCSHAEQRHRFTASARADRRTGLHPHILCNAPQHANRYEKCLIYLHQSLSCPYCRTSLFIKKDGFYCPKHGLTVREATKEGTLSQIWEFA